MLHRRMHRRMEVRSYTVAHRQQAPAMRPSIHARTTPDKPAYRMAGSGHSVSYRQFARPRTGWRISSAAPASATASR